MVKRQSILGQRIPLVVQMHNVICARRQGQILSQYGSLFAFSILAGPILCLLCYAVYRAARYLADAHLPAEVFLLLLIVTWIGIGLQIQLRLHRDLRWHTFVRLMPVRPISVLMVYFWRAIPVGLLGMICLGSGLYGAGVQVWSAGSYPIWLALGLVFAWGMSLQVMLGIVLSLSRVLSRFFPIALLLWCGCLFAGMVGPSDSRDAFLVRMNQLLLHDPVVVLCGLRSLLTQLGPTDNICRWPRWAAVLHVGLLLGLQVVLSWAGARRVPAALTVSKPRYLVVSQALRRVAAWPFPGPRRAQCAIECVRMSRSGYAMLVIYMLLGMIVSLFGQTYSWGDNYSGLAMVAFVMLAVSERVHFLKRRNTDVLNYQYGVDTKDYLYGLNIAVGTLITGMCILQLPLAWNCGWQDVLVGMIACVALAYSALIMCVIFDAYYQHTKLFRGILTGVIFLIALTQAWSWIPPLIIVSFNIIYVPCLAYGLLLLVLSCLNPAWVVVIGIVALWYSIRITSPRFVKEYFWGMEE